MRYGPVSENLLHFSIKSIITQARVHCINLVSVVDVFKQTTILKDQT